MDGGRDQLVAAMASGRVMRPRDDDQFFELKSRGEFGQPRCDDIAGADDGLTAQLVDDHSLDTRIWIRRRDFRRDEWLAQSLLEPDAPEFARLQQAARLGIGVRREREHADRRVGCWM